mmetsp:Transcript_12623/g.18556  ORF Transcript_12623/g.18556 Transcript_12623/m.18556 type:complete len:314 (+) Transcript_12623:82-1023(+)|eukprot:CAMPEP_0194226306 /NCGR_PEP_ID=MMETSP0156-20130528/41606_1 /TAXON_ID=33649 /ORGANISM="Thalassionema nitzschioides, Strain L26-B" /LENGTH=313 /DNA_ID=CAMNT_0038958625 /DNA_START=62 /DNA_END=1003 /DNA_ORIENTATION=+
MRKIKRNKKTQIIPDEIAQLFSRTEEPQMNKQPSLKEFNTLHQKVVSNVKSTTKYIQNDVANERAGERIVKTNFVIKQHLKYVKQRQQKLKKWEEEFEDEVAKYEMAKMACVIRRDQLTTDEVFQSLLNLKCTKSVKIPVLTRILEATSRTWAPHTDEFMAKKRRKEKQPRNKVSNNEPSSETTLQQLEDAIDTVKKANMDILKLENKLRATAELPKRRDPIVDQFKDLQTKTNESITQTDKLIRKTKSEISKFLQILTVELIDRDEIDNIFDKSNSDFEEPTEFRKAISEYKKYRGMIIPLVEEDQSECICM